MKTNAKIYDSTYTTELNKKPLEIALKLLGSLEST
jgi:hypothetical protein